MTRSLASAVLTLTLAVIVLALLTAYDAQRIRRLEKRVHHLECTTGEAAIAGHLSKGRFVYDLCKT